MTARNANATTMRVVAISISRIALRLNMRPIGERMLTNGILVNSPSGNLRPIDG